MPLLITLTVMFAVLAIFAGVYLTLGPDDDVENRLDLGQKGERAGERSQQERLKQQVNQRIERGRLGSGLSMALYQAGVRLTAAEFLAINLALIVLLFFVGWLIGRNVYAGLGLSVLGAILPRFWLKHKKDKRLAAFADQLPDVLSLLVGSLRSGYGLMQALRLVAQEMPSPSREEYERVTQEIAFGVSTTQALGHLVERMESEDLEMVVASIQVQHEVGGNLGEILAVIAETIRERIRIKGEIRSITSMQRATGYMLAGLPFVLAVVLLVLNPEYMMAIFVYPWFFILGFAIFNILIGLFLINKMVNSIDI